MHNKECTRCGKQYRAKTERSKFCPSCYADERLAKRKATNICDKYCDDCIYVGTLSNDRCCNFILQESKLRGCKAGEGCTRKKTRKEARQDRRLAKEAQKRQAKEITYTCRICNAEFKSTRLNRKTCSKECSEAYRQYCSAEIKARKRAIASGAITFDETNGVKISCAGCGKVFYGQSTKTKYCGEECRTKARLATYRRYDQKRK